MNIPRFWASAEGEADTAAGHATPLKCFGWSDEGVAEARSRAKEALARVLERVGRGAPFPARYAYADRPIREEILEEIHDGSGRLQGLITRNAYGAVVLNTSGVMFVDIDDELPVEAALRRTGEILQRMLDWIFRRKTAVHLQEAAAVNLGGSPGNNGVPAFVTAFARANPTWSLRCYRTCAGWRLLVTHDVFDPVSDGVKQTLTAVRSDRKYIELTRVQQCFRARLTPKPWRCDVAPPIRVFPRETAAHQQEHAEWLAFYEEACANFATCRYVATLGSGDACPAAETTVMWHDRVTRAHEALPLA